MPEMSAPLLPSCTGDVDYSRRTLQECQVRRFTLIARDWTDSTQ